MSGSNNERPVAVAVVKHAGPPKKVPKGSRHNFTLALKSALQKRRINPVLIIADELPQLTPQQRVDVMVSLLPYLFPKATPPKAPARKQPIQINTQVNVPAQPAPEPAQNASTPPALSMADLIRIASGADDTPKD